MGDVTTRAMQEVQRHEALQISAPHDQLCRSMDVAVSTIPSNFLAFSIVCAELSAGKSSIMSLDMATCKRTTDVVMVQVSVTLWKRLYTAHGNTMGGAMPDLATRNIHCPSAVHYDHNLPAMCDGMWVAASCHLLEVAFHSADHMPNITAYNASLLFPLVLEWPAENHIGLDRLTSTESLLARYGAGPSPVR